MAQSGVAPRNSTAAQTDSIPTRKPYPFVASTKTAAPHPLHIRTSRATVRGPLDQSAPIHTEIPSSTRPCPTCFQSGHGLRPSTLATRSRQSPAPPAPALQTVQAACTSAKENPFSPATLLIILGLHTIR